jgi:glycosyltransferase involved in cell wall biosynthesis
MTGRSSHITIFTPSFADESNTNGQNLTVKQIVARLPPELFHVDMICAGDPDPRIAARENTRLLNWSKHGNTPRLISALLLSRPDIYFFPRYGPLDRTFFDLRKYLRLRTALVSYVVMTMNEVTAAPLVQRSIVEADQVFANSEYVAQTVSERFGVKAEVVYDGADPRYFFPRKDNDVREASKPLTVLYVGSFQPRKRVEVVIQQAARWPNIQFRLVGRGETESLCRALCQQYGCRNVCFLGQLSPAQLGEEMRRADVFLFPSVLEGHPAVLVQATACGLPSVAMNLYRPTYVVNGKTGFLVDSDQELAERLDQLVTSPELRYSMSQASVRHARNFDWDRIAQQWARIFQEVVEERRTAAYPRVRHA